MSTPIFLRLLCDVYHLQAKVSDTRALSLSLCVRVRVRVRVCAWTHISAAEVSFVEVGVSQKPFPREMMSIRYWKRVKN